jgi:hypothetical protein
LVTVAVVTDDGWVLSSQFNWTLIYIFKNKLYKINLSFLDPVLRFSKLKFTTFTTPTYGSRVSLYVPSSGRANMPLTLC